MILKMYFHNARWNTITGRIETTLVMVDRDIEDTDHAAAIMSGVMKQGYMEVVYRDTTLLIPAHSIISMSVENTANTGVTVRLGN